MAYEPTRMLLDGGEYYHRRATCPMIDESKAQPVPLLDARAQARECPNCVTSWPASSVPDDLDTEEGGVKGDGGPVVRGGLPSLGKRKP